MKQKHCTQTLSIPDDHLLSQLDDILANGQRVTIIRDRSCEIRQVGVCFLKPEVCSAGSNFCLLALKELERCSLEFGFAVTGLYGLSGIDLVQSGILASNYEKIAHFALIKLPAHMLSTPFASAAEKCFGEPVPVIGSKVLADNGLDARVLLSMWQNAERTLRLGDDCYVAPTQVNGKNILLVNGFFPFHEQQYSGLTSRVLVGFIETRTKFQELKKRFQGNADPALRSKTCYRSFLSDEIVRLGLPALTTSLNGVHLSSSKTEGWREYKMFQPLIRAAIS